VAAHGGGVTGEEEKRGDANGYIVIASFLVIQNIKAEEPILQKAVHDVR